MLESRIFRTRFAGLLVPIFGVALATPGFAQTAAPIAPPTASSIVAQDELFQVDQRNPIDNSTGAFFNGLPLPNLGYSVRVALLSGYDSNYARLPDGVAPPPGESKSSFRFTPTLNGTVNMPLGRQSLYASALVGKDFYTSDSDYNRQRLLFSGGANLAAGSSCTGNISGSWIQSQSNPNSTLVINIPNTQTTTSFGVSATCGGLGGFTPSASYRYAKAVNEDPLRAFSDLTSNSYSLSLGYGRPSLGVISVYGTLSDNSYPNQSIATFTRGVSIANLGVQYSRSLTSQFSANASLSYVEIKPDAQVSPSSSNLGYSLSINYTPPSRFSASINASQNASSSPNTGTALFFVQRAFGFNMAYRLNSTLSGTLSGSTSLRDYEDQILIIDPNQITSDRFNRVRASINWIPMRNMNASFYVQQQNRNAVPDTFDYKNTTAGILISYGI